MTAGFPGIKEIPAVIDRRYSSVRLLSAFFRILPADYSDVGSFVRTTPAINVDQRVWFLSRRMRRAAARVSGVPLLAANDPPAA